MPNQGSRTKLRTSHLPETRCSTTPAQKRRSSRRLLTQAAVGRLHPRRQVIWECSLICTTSARLHPRHQTAPAFPLRPQAVAGRLHPRQAIWEYSLLCMDSARATCPSRVGLWHHSPWDHQFSTPGYRSPRAISWKRKGCSCRRSPCSQASSSRWGRPFVKAYAQVPWSALERLEQCWALVLLPLEARLCAALGVPSATGR